MARSDARPELLRRVRRAYERGRVRAALRRTAPFAAAAAVAGLSSGAAVGLALAAALFAIAAVACWRGGVSGRAAQVGLWAGVPSLAVPLVIGALHHGCRGCGGPSFALCLAVCGVAGVIAGLVVARRAGDERAGDRAWFLAVAVLVTALAGVIACMYAGGAGLVGMAGGLVAAGAPTLASARAR